MPGPYVATGPFVNGSAPAIAAAFLNNLEAYIAWSEGDTPITVTGTTAGSATCYQFFQGQLKGLFLYWAAYRNATATEQLLTLPVGFTTHAGWIAFGGIPQAHIYVGAVQQNNNIYVITGFPTPPGAGATTGNQNQFNGFQYGGINTAFDHIGLGVSQAVTFSGSLLIIGI
jgi:hypothetical protein